LLLLVIALHLWLAWGGAFPGDTWAIERTWHPQAAFWRTYASLFQDLGTPTFAILLVLAALAAIVARGSFAEAAGLAIACCAIPLNALLKSVLGPSPVWFAAHRGGHDYPSGHVTFVVAVIGYIGWLGWRHGRRWIAVLAAALIALVGPARVVTGIHIVSDVVGAYLLGAAVLVLAVTCARRLDVAR
jgi:undecaprenyl-diphosphatase